MILYHATPGVTGEKIINTRTIKNNCPRLWDGEVHHANGKVEDISTTDGYVYLSNKLSLAAFYGNVSRMNVNNCDDYYIFRVNIPEELLKPDQDELKINHGIEDILTARESLDACGCACVDFSIKADEYNIEYIHIDTNDFSAPLNKEIYYLCSEHKNDMQPDPVELIDKIDKINKIANWEKL